MINDTGPSETKTYPIVSEYREMRDTYIKSITQYAVRRDSLFSCTTWPYVLISVFIGASASLYQNPRFN